MESNENVEEAPIEEAPKGRRGRRKSVFPLKVPCVIGRINAGADRITVVSAEIPAEACAQFYVEQALVNFEGFQRAMDTRRAEQIGKLQAAEIPHFQPGLAAYGEAEEVTLTTRGPHPMLTIHKPLKWLDGQHRGGGDRYAVAAGRGDYTESVRIEIGGTPTERIGWYLTANMSARKTGPGNVLLNISRMQGTQRGKKSWIARLVRELATEEPFVVGETPLINWGTGERVKAPIQAGTLYRAIDLMLPEALNTEGSEAEAIQYAHKAWSFYADMFGDRWGALNEEGTKFRPLDAYAFTMLVAFARLYAATEGHEDLVRKAFDLAHLTEGIPSSVGSGERAASSLAALAAGSVGVDLQRAMPALAA